MEHKRVVLIGRRMLREMVGQLLAGEPLLDIVDGGDLDSKVVTQLAGGDAALVIVGDGEDDVAAACSALLQEHARFKALAIVGDGRSGYLYELRPLRRPLGELSPQTLVAAVRDAVEVRA